jgi:phosphocarrier protein HPr
MERTLKLTNESGLHARPAGIFVKAANQFASKIQIQVNNQSVNAKSIMNILSLGLESGAEFTLVADGPDEATALDSLAALIEKKFEV